MVFKATFNKRTICVRLKRMYTNDLELVDVTKF